MKNKKVWVIKAGSQMVIDGGPLLIRDWMQQVKCLKTDYNIEVIWVTSGAIATARRQSGISGQRLSEKQALSAMGQPLIHSLYHLGLEALGLRAAQVLLTADDLGNRKRRANLVSTLTTLIEWNVTPILNENDAVSTEEIQFGDNDRLSALVSIALQAERLILLTDVDGLYDRDPKTATTKNPARLIETLAGIDKKTLALAGHGISTVGKGGMRSKLLAAKETHKHGIDTHLIRGDRPHALVSIADPKRFGKSVGTHVSRKRSR